MVIIMRKYLFLLALFFIYVILILKKQDTTLVNYSSDNINSVKTVTLKFENGVNYKDLINYFNINNNYYFVENIQVDNNMYEVKCNKIERCIKSIYEQENEEFNNKYIASGFLISSVTYLTYDSELK